MDSNNLIAVAAGRTLRAATLSATLALVIGGAASAHATFPSPGGAIAFDSERDGNAEIYRMRANGAGQTRLTDDPAVDIRPAWSPDGRKIAFCSDRADDQFDVFRMNADGRNPVDLTNNPAFDFSPDWQR